MKIAGVIAEYNPFHTGHAYHIEKTREKTGADFVIAVMSGDFVQRGGPAFLPKHLRAQMALLGGADLVFELPSVYSCESAEFFAKSGVELLHGLGCVDVLSFGSESGDIRLFQTLGKYLTEESPAFQEQLRTGLKSGLSYPAARRDALLSVWKDDDEYPADLTGFLSSPNNILGIEYCKALSKLKSSIQPVTIQRKGSGYHEQSLSKEFPSASALRASWSDPDKNPGLSAGFLPEVWTALLKEDAWNRTVTEQDFSLLFRWMLYAADAKELSTCQDMTPDLVRRLLNTRGEYENFSQYLTLLKTKELTHSRICRAMFHALLGIREVPPIAYARLLGFRKKLLPYSPRSSVMHLCRFSPNWLTLRPF